MIKSNPLTLSVATSTDTVVIDNDTVSEFRYGYSNKNLYVDNLFIINSDTGSATASVKLWLRTTTIDRFDKVTHTPNDSGEESTTSVDVQLLYNASIPTGTALRVDERMLKDVDFIKQHLYINTSTGTVDVIVNFKRN